MFVFEQELRNAESETIARLAIFRNPKQYPTEELNNTVTQYIETNKFNQFIERNLLNPEVRIVISGGQETNINDLNYQLIKTYTEQETGIETKVEFFEQELITDSEVSSRIILFQGGLKAENPTAIMQQALNDYIQSYPTSIVIGGRGYVAHNDYRFFVEISLDNPYFYVVIKGLNNLPFKNLHFK